jgi:hypothetical protein
MSVPQPSTFPPQTLRQYALLADGERGALCGPHGEIVWMCAPRWHDDAVFATLIGGAGAYAVTPSVRCVWGGWYEPRSLIWRNRWTGDDGSVVECRDALARPSDVDRSVLLRHVCAAQGHAEVDALLDVRAGFGADPMTEVHRDDTGVWTARCGELWMRWTGAGNAHVDDRGRLRLTLDVRDEAGCDLVLEIGRGTMPPPLPPAKELWARTEQAWEDDLPSFDSCAAPRDTVHAYAVLRGLTSAGGGMVAAATTSLPEHADKNSNYDYRYVWIRDQAYAGIAVAADGGHPLLSAACATVAGHLIEDGSNLRPAYRVDGGSVPQVKELDLSGYPGGTPQTGNRAVAQFQLDAFGESLQLFAAAAGHGLLTPDGDKAVDIACAAIAARWDEPDAGIWELDDAWWTQSRLASVAGLRSIAPHLSGARRQTATELADAILRETTRRCVTPEGYWGCAPGQSRVDAALLLPPVRGALPAGDPRTHATLRRVREELMEDGYVYRFAPDDGRLGEDEGAFVLCGFALALAELHQGDVVAAFRAFERNRSACGPPGLLAEEFDVRQRQLRGNLPQAFVHALLLETSVRLGPHSR